MLNDETINSFKTHVINRLRASMSAIMRKLGKKAKKLLQNARLEFLEVA